jgi:branched-chain amino acid transport system substrate-binding protein
MTAPLFRVVFASLLLLAACDKAPASSGGPATGPVGAGDPAVIKIVSSLPRTGSARNQTNTIVNGITMALEEAGWKAGNFTIKYEDLDDATAAAGQWTAEKEAANADQAIKDPDVMVYIGTYNSGAAKVSMPKLNQANLVMISPANSWPGLTKPGKGDQGEPEKYRPSGKINYVRVVPADDIQGVVSADWAVKLGLKKVFILDDREVYGKGIADLFHARADELKDKGLTILGHEGIDANAQEFKALMTKVKAKAPQLIYFGGTTQTKAGQLVKDMLAVGLDAKFMCPDGCFEEAFIDSAGADNLQDRALITFGGMPPEKLAGKGATFVVNYKKKFAKDPEGYAVYGYECGKVALEAIRRAGKKDRDQIRAATLTITNFDGALGKWSFDKNGDTSLRTMSGNTVKGGKFEFVTVLGED